MPLGRWVMMEGRSRMEEEEEENWVWWGIRFRNFISE